MMMKIKKRMRNVFGDEVAKIIKRIDNEKKEKKNRR
jgi:hypothetical protein